MEIASDNLTGGGSSHLMEASEPMECSSTVASTFPTKRKAESDPAEENEEIDNEDEECSDESEEDNAYFESKWITPEWDVDSFNGLKFDDEKEAKDTEYIEEKDVQNWLSFRRQHIENKGFCVDRDLWPMYVYSKYRVIEDLENSVGLGLTYRDYLKELACLQKFNQEEQKKKESFINVEFVKVVGGVVRPSDCPKYYITFMAKEKPGGPDVEYQAKAWTDIVKDSKNGREYYPILCRRAPPPKTSN